MLRCHRLRRSRMPLAPSVEREVYSVRWVALAFSYMNCREPHSAVTVAPTRRDCGRAMSIYEASLPRRVGALQSQTDYRVGSFVEASLVTAFPKPTCLLRQLRGVIRVPVSSQQSRSRVFRCDHSFLRSWSSETLAVEHRLDRFGSRCGRPDRPHDQMISPAV